MIKFLWALALLGALAGALGLVAAVLVLPSAPQQAVGAAAAIGLAVIPYCLARAAEGLR